MIYVRGLLFFRGGGFRQLHFNVKRSISQMRFHLLYRQSASVEASPPLDADCDVHKELIGFWFCFVKRREERTKKSTAA